MKSDFDHSRNQKRMEISKDIIEEKAEVLEIKAEGASVIQQLYYFIHFVDWVSLYLAEQNQIDPFPVENIDFLKSKLAD
jgi:glucose/mannose-6-phosphate isomerase